MKTKLITLALACVTIWGGAFTFLRRKEVPMSEAILLSGYLNTLEAISNAARSVLTVSSSGTLQLNTAIAPSLITPVCQDADTAWAGWARTGATTTHLPSGGLGGFLLTLQYDVRARIQLFFQWALAAIFIRRHSSGTPDDKWESWKRLAVETS